MSSEDISRADETHHVLLAEDDDDDFEIFSLAISEISYRVLLTRVEDGEKLMTLLEQSTPDILFLDTNIPVKNAQACLREIRANHRYDFLPIIIYSSLDNVRDIEMCYRDGANLFVIKPSSYSELKNALEQILCIDWKKGLYFPQLSSFVIRPSKP